MQLYIVRYQGCRSSDFESSCVMVIGGRHKNFKLWLLPIVDFIHLQLNGHILSIVGSSTGAALCMCVDGNVCLL